MNVVTRLILALRRYAGRPFSDVRRRKDRWLHPVRHRRVVRRLRQLEPPGTILVLCHGNICRSPYLEAVLRHSLSDTEILSAGLIGPGRPAPAHALTVASRRGVDLAPHRSRVITRDVLESADLVIVMDAHQARYLTRALGLSPARIVIAGDLDPKAGETRAIHDPWQQELQVFESSYDRLDRCAVALTAILLTPRKQ